MYDKTIKVTQKNLPFNVCEKETGLVEVDVSR